MKISLNACCMATIIGFSTLTSSLSAALPPLYATLSEYKSLLRNPELAEKIGSGEPIQEIKRTDNGFLVTTNKHNLNVDIVYEPQDNPGPAKFHFIFHDAEPLR